MMNLGLGQTVTIIWAREKGIVELKNATSQLVKFDEESGELSGAILKNNYDLLVDSIGDTLVTLIILAEQMQYKILLPVLNEHVLSYITTAETTLLSRAKYLMMLKGELAQNATAERLQSCIYVTLEIAHVAKLDPAHCLEVAYNVIKNRKGKTVNGTFIKESDLPCEQ